MTDLHTRLRSAIEERLALAQAATEGPWQQAWLGEKLGHHLGSVVERDDGSHAVVGRLHRGADALHVIANDPTFVIRACRADLARLDAHEVHKHGECDVCVADGSAYTYDPRPSRQPCPEVRRMAEVVGGGGLMGRYRSWGLDADRGAGWWDDAVCRGRAPMFFTRDSFVAGQAVHLCRAHCPVLAQCAREASRLMPVGAVQAGVWWYDGTSHLGPRGRQPADPGCGPWCAHLRHLGLSGQLRAKEGAGHG